MKNARPAPRFRKAAGALLLLLLAPLLSHPARPADADGADAFFERVAATWAGRQMDAWLALWEFGSAQERTDERLAARAAFAADETSLGPVRPPVVSADGRTATADLQVFVVDEPRARVSYTRLFAERRQRGWALIRREISSGDVEGLVHLSLAEPAWHARNLKLQLEDLELRLHDGTLYATGEDVGRTALVFVGSGRVHFGPRPPAEREQLRQFSGSAAIERDVDWLFVRLHPGDFRRLVDASLLSPEPQPQRHRETAERVFRERSPRSYMIEAPLPRSPWWLMPSLRDAVVDFPWARGHVLSYALAPNEAEDVNLFDRDRRLQVCSYPSAGKPPRRGAEDRGSFDVEDQELTVRLDPERRDFTAVHAMRVHLLEPAATLRLRLADDLRVSSVSTAEGQALLFFRIHEQNALVVALGALAERGAFTIVTRYSGRHAAFPVEDEIVQSSVSQELDLGGLVEEPPIVYSNRTSWYPRPPSEDFATATVRFETPEGWLAVTGGDLVSIHTESRRTRSEFRLRQPGKYLTAVVGRFSEIGLRQQGGQTVRGYANGRLRSHGLERMVLAEEMLAYFAGLFGASPYPSLGLVLAEGRTPGGHSPPGLVYLQERPPIMRRELADDPANFSDVPGFFLAHELAHQWWGQGTAPVSYRDRWLSEGWAQYSAALWARERLGEGAFRRMMDRMARWALRHDEQGPIDLGQRLGTLRQDARIMRAIVYDKGAWVLHMLRGIVGDRVFFQAARDFLRGRRYGKASSLDLQRAFEAASGRDLRPYFERWVDGTGLPRLRYQARTERGASGFVTTVDVSSENLPGPVPLEIALVGDGLQVQRVQLPPSGGSWTFETAAAPRRVVINEDRGLLARVESGPARRPGRQGQR